MRRRPRGAHSAPRPARSVRPVGLAGALFVVGLAVGLLGATLAPPGSLSLSQLRTPGSPADSAAAEVLTSGSRGATDQSGSATDQASRRAATAESCRPAPLRRRAAQVLVVGLPDTTGADDPLAREVVELGVGGVFLSEVNAVDARQVRALAGGLQRRSAVPLLISTDEELGRVSSFRDLLGPSSSARALAQRPTRSVRARARDLGDQLADIGLTVDLAPVADLDAGPWRGVIGDRSFSGDPVAAGEYATAFANGLVDAGVLPVAKHFPGHGRAPGDVHLKPSSVEVSLDELMATDVQPFQAMVHAGVPIVMLGHVAYDALEPDRPASLSNASYSLLRDLGFTGVAMTDALGMGAVNGRWTYSEAAVMAVRAGADALLATDGRQARAMRNAIIEAVHAGRLDDARLNEAAARMLTLKGVDPQAMTCLDAPPLPQMARRAGVAADS